MFKKILFALVIALLMITNLASSSPVKAQTVNANTNGSCNAPKVKVKIWTVFTDLGSLLPIIPKDCGQYTNELGQNVARPLGLNALPDIIIRGLGLIFGLAFYIIPMWIVLFGAFVAAQPFSKEFNFIGAGDIRTTPILVITSKAGQLVGGILLISIVWVVVFTVLDLVGLEGVETNISGFINHDSSNSFFVGQ